MAHLNLKMLGKKLRAAREARGVTQEEVATFLNCTKQLISHWETGRCEITLSDLVKLVRFYGLTIDALVSSKSVRRSAP